MEARLKGGTETILVAEDNEAIRDVAQVNLEKLGYRVFTAPDGAAALEIFARARGQFDLLLLDVVMPILNGPDAYARMSEIRPGTPVLFTTGYVAEPTVDRLRSCDGVVILQKPYSPLYLAQKVRQLLDAKHC
jgi:two-component system, cell cycle sensor histidine kinase and response regulator CckA